MNYNQYGFWCFFFAVLTLYWRLGHKAQNRLMLLASYVFYGFWDYRFLFLILISTVIDYIGGLGVAGVRVGRAKLLRLGAGLTAAAWLLCGGIDYAEVWRALRASELSGGLGALAATPKELLVPLCVATAAAVYGLLLPRLYALAPAARRKLFLTVSMAANLGILGFFKYFDFFAVSLSRLLGAAGVEVSPHTLGLILPAGISFYTFQAMSYTIDIYRGQVEPTESFSDFALFVCFFPHLVAGPIMRAHTLLPQVLEPRRLKPGAVEEGLILVLLGLFKKIVIADNMAPIANAVFARFAEHGAQAVTGPETLVALYAFAFQIYGDFSGYSSIARGISKWLGFELVINFDLPYLAVSPSDFWRRWHISLSTWLRDYLYIPLGGNHGGPRRMYRNLMLTMLLGGLWHGASWTFVAWGLYHGLLLCAFRFLNVGDALDVSTTGGVVRRAARVLGMFHLTCLGWLLFRADSFSTVTAMAARVVTDFRVTPAAVSAFCLIAFYCGGLSLLEWFLAGERRVERLARVAVPVQAGIYGYLTLMMFFFYARHAYEFIYFQF